MMTQPIKMFDSLTSEAPPAGGNDLTSLGYSYEERRLIEMRARYARASVVADGLIGALLWVGRLAKRAANAIKADFRLRAAEQQLFRMSDRELADIGLTRSDILFAVRDVPVEGVVPQFDNPHAAEVAAANRNASPAIYWAGRA